MCAKAMDMTNEKMTVIANNLANVNTVGFKKDITYVNSFANKLLSNINQMQSPEVPGELNVVTDFKQGNFRFTGDKLNIALDGEGFIKVKLPSGQLAYTRKGMMTLNKDKQLCIGDAKVMTERGPIMLKSNDIAIDDKGNIYDNTGDLVATIATADFEKPYKLSKAGSTMFVMDGNMREIPVKAEFKQQYLEESNVDALSSMVEMISMMEAMRNYETQQKLVQMHDEATGKMITQITQG